MDGSRFESRPAGFRRTNRVTNEIRERRCSRCENQKSRTFRGYAMRGRLIGKLGMRRANRVILSSTSPRLRRKTSALTDIRRLTTGFRFVGHVQKARIIINIIIAIIPGLRITPSEHRYTAVSAGVKYLGTRGTRAPSSRCSNKTVGRSPSEINQRRTTLLLGRPRA